MRIVHTFGRNAGVAIEVAKDVVKFGRAPDNEVSFDPEYDRDASAHHAEARLEGGAWMLVDLNSRNGLFVGSERVTKRALADGDEITFGAKGPRVRVEIRQGAAVPNDRAPYASGTAVDSPLPQAFAPIAAPAQAQPFARAQPIPDDQPVAPARPAKTAPDNDETPAPLARAGQPVGRFAAPVQAAPAMAPAAGARVGQRTMAMMISNAVAAATGRSRPMKTVEISALVDAQVGAATAGHRKQTYFLGVLLILAFAGLGAVIYLGRASSDEIAALRGELAKLPPEDPRRKDIESKLGTLHPPNANFGRNLYDRTKKGIFMLAAGGEGFCTAFAVRPNVLATNAHCVVAAKKHGGSIVALENEGRGQASYAVSDMKAHPLYRDQDEQHITPDVGIVTISGQAAIVLDLATAAELQQVGAGDEVYLIGFPGRLMDASNPAATFMGAHVGRVTDATGRPGAFAEDWLVQHDALTTHGTSGSPVFNGKGHVIAVNAGGYLEGDDEQIAGKKTAVVKDSPYKFGMRVDLLSAILK
jgi:V8-like Glu-specific endopeptidase